MQPAAGIDGRARRVRVVVVAAHHVVAAHADLAALAGRAPLARRRIDDLDLLIGQRDTNGLRSLLDRRIARCRRDPGRRLRHPVRDRDFRQMHIRYHTAHQRLRTERAGHDAGPQRREIEAGEIGRLQLSEEHRRHAVQRGAALAVNRLEHARRVERFDRAQPRAVSERAEDADDAAEAMEQRHAEAETVGRGESQDAAERTAVVDDVAAREHHAFRKPGGSRRVLHVDHVVEADALRVGVQDGVADAARAGSHVLIRNQAGRHVVADEDDSTQRGQRAAHGADLVEGRDIVDAAETLDRDKRRGFALAEEIINLGRAQRGIHRDENRADLRERELEHDPLGNIGRPQRDAIRAALACREPEGDARRL